jgi:hypothetical protein
VAIDAGKVVLTRRTKSWFQFSLVVISVLFLRTFIKGACDLNCTGNRFSKLNL